jgi:hypothetical protein
VAGPTIRDLRGIRTGDQRRQGPAVGGGGLLFFGLSVRGELAWGPRGSMPARGASRLPQMHHHDPPDGTGSVRGPLTGSHSGAPTARTGVRSGASEKVWRGRPARPAPAPHREPRHHDRRHEPDADADREACRREPDNEQRHQDDEPETCRDRARQRPRRLTVAAASLPWARSPGIAHLRRSGWQIGDGVDRAGASGRHDGMPSERASAMLGRIRARTASFGRRQGRRAGVDHERPARALAARAGASGV